MGYYREYKENYTDFTAHFKATTVDVTDVLLETTAVIEVGKTETLTATVEPSDATDKTVTWTSSDETVATVDGNGMVTAVKAGTATITAKAGDKTATCVVIVTASSGGNSGGSSGGYISYIPSGGTTTTTTTTNTGSFADETKENTNYAGAEINMRTEDLKKAVLTDEDIKFIEAGGDVSIELVVEKMTPTEEEKRAVEAAVEAEKEASGKDYTVAMYLDVNLFKTSNGTTTQLHEINGKIAVSLTLPEQVKRPDGSVRALHIHNNAAEILDCKYAPITDLLTLYIDGFSTYALMYEDTKADDADVSAVDDDDEQGDEGAVDDEQFDETDDDFDELTDDEGDFDDDFAEDQTDADSDTDNDDQAAVDAAATTDDSNPNTGVPLAGMGVFAVMSLFAAAAAYTAKKRKNK